MSGRRARPPFDACGDPYLDGYVDLDMIDALGMLRPVHRLELLLEVAHHMRLKVGAQDREALDLLDALVDPLDEALVAGWDLLEQRPVLIAREVIRAQPLDPLVRAAEQFGWGSMWLADGKRVTIADVHRHVQAVITERLSARLGKTFMNWKQAGVFDRAMTPPPPVTGSTPTAGDHQVVQLPAGGVIRREF